jgi:hypothetical protein
VGLPPSSRFSVQHACMRTLRRPQPMGYPFTLTSPRVCAAERWKGCKLLQHFPLLDPQFPGSEVEHPSLLEGRLPPAWHHLPKSSSSRTGGAICPVGGRNRSSSHWDDQFDRNAHTRHVRSSAIGFSLATVQYLPEPLSSFTCSRQLKQRITTWSVANPWEAVLEP